MGNQSNPNATPLVVLFDGVCNLCNGWVNRVIDRDPDGRVLFLPLQSKAAKAILQEARVGEVPMSTIVLVEGGRASVRSSAVLRVARVMKAPWNWAWPLFGWIPALLRDLVYRAIAANRYRVFGRQKECRIPTPELKAHFLDPDDVSAALAAAGLTHRRPVEVSTP
jgi:predicted DCC family thiol-disulfide oxidoreductase YuxK